MLENINWSVFTEEEHNTIQTLLDMRMPEHIAASIENMDGFKELEIQKIVSQLRPLNDVNEESLRNKIIEDYYKEHSNGPQTPEEEMILQKQLDDEIAKFHQEQIEKANLQIENLTK